MRAKNSLLNSIILYIMVAIRVVTGLILTRLIITLYGSDINGIDASIMSILNYLNVVEGGVGAATLYHLYKPIAEGNNNDINSLLTYTNILYKKIGSILIFCTLVISGVYPFLLTSFGDKILINQLIFINAAIIVSTYFFDGKYSILMQADQRLRCVTVANIFETLIGKCLAIVLALCGQPFVLVKLSLIVGMFVRIGVIYFFKAKRYPWINLKNRNENIKTKIILNNSKDLLIQKVCSLIFSTTDVLLISIFCGVKSVSVYAVYNIVISLLQQLMSPIIDASYSSFGNIFNSSNRAHIRNVFNNFEHLMIIITSIVTVTFLILINPFISFYTQGVEDVNYLNTGLGISLAALFLIRYYRTLYAGALNVTGNFKEAKKYYFLEMIFNLTLSLIFINIFGMIGVVVASVIATTISSMFMFKCVNYVILKQSIVPLAKQIFVNGSMVVLIALLPSLLKLVMLDYSIFNIIVIIIYLFALITMIAINFIFWPNTYHALKQYANILINKKQLNTK